MQGVDPYADRKQTQAKHFILKRYLEQLAFKVLTFSDITYVDGFSGPWKAETEDLSDTSFMIAIRVLRTAQEKTHARCGHFRRIRCFFSEVDPKAYMRLQAAVAPHHRPQESFEIRTFHGKFEDAVTRINEFRGSSFPLIFIDPTGWTGYPFDKIKPLFAPPKCEVLITFMHEFINRFAQSEDPDVVDSFSPILGGPDWPSRLDPHLTRGAGVEKLFRETLKEVGRFRFVVSTKIDKATAERPHFFIAYATKSPDGLKAFRDTEYAALRTHARNRAHAITRKREEQNLTVEMFAEHDAEVQEETIDQIVNQQKVAASIDLLETLARHGPMRFSIVVDRLLQAFILRETNVKDICVELAKASRIKRTWSGNRKKPNDTDLIQLLQPLHQ